MVSCSAEALLAVAAHGQLHPAGIGGWRSVEADLVFPTEATATARSSMKDGAQLLMQATVRGSRAVMRLDNFIGPHACNADPALGGRIHVTTGDDMVLDEPFADEATYTYQLRAFRDAVRGGPALPVQGAGAVANMTLIDAVRAAAAIGWGVLSGPPRGGHRA